MDNKNTGFVFSAKAEKYLKYRWDYTEDVIRAITAQAGLDAGSVVADIGAGPGTLARHFVGRVSQVILVEPNEAMRSLAIQALGAEPCCRIVAGRAEATTLPGNSVDLITAGQASNWFQPEPARVEFRRILKADGVLAFLRFKVVDQDPALAAAIEAAYPKEMDTEAIMAGLGVPLSGYFSGGETIEEEFPFTVQQGWGDFLGGLSSASYAPDEDSPHYPEFKAKLRDAFDRHSDDGVLVVKVMIQLQMGRM